MDYEKTLRDNLADIRKEAVEISEILQELGAHMAVAESCTGGLIASSCTGIRGASEWFDTGVVSYTRKSKQGVLGLADRDVRDGLVTEQTAIAMCEHVAKIAEVPYAVATTGVAGPETSEGYKPCAAWVAAHSPLGTVSQWIEEEDKGREINRTTIALYALKLLHGELLKYQEAQTAE